jgi:hypothetical protein
MTNIIGYCSRSYKIMSIDYLSAKVLKISSVVSVLLLLFAPLTDDAGTPTFDKIVYLKRCVFSTALLDNPTQQLLLIPC